MSRLSELKDLIKAESSRAYKLKTRRAKQRAWDKVKALRREALDTILYPMSVKHGPQSIKATVRTFHAGDEHFLIDTPYGSMWVSPASDVATKSWYPHTCCIEYTVGQEVVVEIEYEVNYDGLFLQILPGHIYGGRVNETQYAELCKRDDLAFFKYPNSSGVTGLFATKAVSHE